MSKEKLIIFDTTMRDGEQSPGASMTRDEKIRIARQLERMNGRYAAISLCIGVGQGLAMIIERTA